MGTVPPPRNEVGHRLMQRRRDAEFDTAGPVAPIAHRGGHADIIDATQPPSAMMVPFLIGIAPLDLSPRAQMRLHRPCRGPWVERARRRNVELAHRLLDGVQQRANHIGALPGKQAMNPTAAAITLFSRREAAYLVRVSEKYLTERIVA